MPTKYLIAALPVQSPGGDSDNSLWRRLQDSISRNCPDTPLYRVSTYPTSLSATIP